jgi:hypothetical protein
MSIPSPARPTSRWKTIIVPGLLGGLLLTLVQVCVGFLGTGHEPHLGFPFLPHSDLAIVVLVWLMYLVIPALQAFLIALRTHQPVTGSQAGRFAGRFCAVVFILITLTYPLAPSMDLVASTSPYRLSPLYGLGGFIAVFLLRVLAVFYHLVGIQLAMLGAFLGSRIMRRQSVPGEPEER